MRIATKLPYLTLLIAASLQMAVVPVRGAQQYGPVTPKNASEATVLALLDTAFNQRQVDKAFREYVGSYYRQHDPMVADGKQAIIDGLRQWLPATPDLHYEFQHVNSDGDRVIVHSLVTEGKADRGKAVVDIFRLEHGKVVEHWDVAQPVPEKALNDNTMF